MTSNSCKLLPIRAARSELARFAAPAPVNSAGEQDLRYAEALAGPTLAQLVRPATPVCYGSFISDVDMQTGSPEFGTPESVVAAFASSQLALRYGLPLRASAGRASNGPDAQAAYAMQMSQWGALMSRTNLLIRGAGWLERELTASAEEFIMDAAMLQGFAELFKPVSASEAALAVDTIADVGPGGHFFGARHTVDRFENAFHTPLLSEWSNLKIWRDPGIVDTTRRAHRIYKKTLSADEPPALDPARLDAMDASSPEAQPKAGLLSSDGRQRRNRSTSFAKPRRPSGRDRDSMGPASADEPRGPSARDPPCLLKVSSNRPSRRQPVPQNSP